MFLLYYPKSDLELQRLPVEAPTNVLQIYSMDSVAR